MTTASELRSNIYRLLDTVIETGQPLEIERKGRVLRIVPEPVPSKLARLTRRDFTAGNPEDLVDLHPAEWHPEPHE